MENLVDASGDSLLLDLEAAALLLGVSKHTLRRLAVTQRIERFPSLVRLGRRIFLRRQELIDWATGANNASVIAQHQQPILVATEAGIHEGRRQRGRPRKLAPSLSPR